MYENHLSNTLKLDILLVLEQRTRSFSFILKKKQNKDVEHEIEIIYDKLPYDLTFIQHRENFKIAFFKK